MTALEITLIVIGVVFLVGSFFVSDKLSQKDVDQIAKMSEEELRVILDRQLEKAKTEIQNAIETGIDETTEETKRALEKETNDKINGISEYSDTVLESINKSHNEIMFLYSMLNDKHKDLTDLAANLQKLTANLHDVEQQMTEKTLRAQARLQQPEPIIEKPAKVQKKEIPVEKKVKSESIKKAVEVKKKPETDTEINEKNDNDAILRLHAEGKSDVEIAKLLDRGLGEVRLVIGLHRGEDR
ncbi:MAG: DUF6115 domain-containing protein [Lachnobacterium sp.]|nr:DUF6115 domain-containing protein [Lachnobacterium sp.]MDY2912638.1 DUF6115 domain-containing protein [Agathobacter sp.]